MKLYGEMHRFLPAIASEQGVVDRRDRGEPPRAASTANRSTASARTIRVDARSADREVPAELFDAAAADFRARSASSWVCSARSSADGSRVEWFIGRDVARRNRPLLLFGILLIFDRFSARSRSVCSPSSRRGHITNRRTSRPMPSARSARLRSSGRSSVKTLDDRITKPYSLAPSQPSTSFPAFVADFFVQFSSRYSNLCCRSI